MKQLSLCQKIFYMALLCTTANISPMLIIQYFPPKLTCGSSRLEVLDYFQIKSMNEAAMRRAAQKDDETEILRLINEGIDVNANDPNGDTPLHFAANNGCVKAGKTLITNNALVNRQNFKHETPLHDAIATLLTKKDNDSSVDFIDLLLNNGAQINIKNKLGHRPDKNLAITVAGTPPNELDKKIYLTLSQQCIDINKKYRLKNIIDISVANSPTEEINKQKRLNLNRAHALLLCERLKNPEQSRATGTTAPHYHQETIITPYAFWCPYTNNFINPFLWQNSH